MKKLLTYTYVALLTIIISFPSCESVIEDVDFPEQDPKLVVQCFISPQDSFINVWVSESIPVLGTPYYQDVKFINNATVTISEGPPSAAEIPFTGNDGLYSIPASDYPIHEGASYYLSVRDSQGRIVSGECTVPVPSNKTLEIHGIDTVVNYDYPEYYIRFSFKDTPGMVDFYRVAGIFHLKKEFNFELTEIPMDITNGEEFISDYKNDGETFYYREPTYYIESDSISILLLTTDETYYRYHISVVNYQGNDPFYEPTLIYSNIEDGLGIFAAYNQYRQVYVIP